MNPSISKIIVILGVTASGKTDLAIKLAKKFNGEIVSADSRQVYKEFDIGTAKPEGRWMLTGGKRKFVAGGAPHYLIDIIDPKENFTLVDYKKKAIEKINEIIKAVKLPLLVGGTALYIKAVCENWSIPQVEPNLTLRKKLGNKKTEDLYNELKRADPEAAVLIGPKNKRRIIRALEVIYQTGHKFSDQRKKGQPLFDCLKLGLQISKEDFAKKIRKRTDQMIKNGLAEEVKKLRQKYPWSLAPMQSIDYQEFKEYFENKITLADTIKLINQHHIAYAKRQMTWFKKDKTINWVSSPTEAENIISNFLK